MTTTMKSSNAANTSPGGRFRTSPPRNAKIQTRTSIINLLINSSIVITLTLCLSNWLQSLTSPGNNPKTRQVNAAGSWLFAEAVSVQKLNVPDLVVIDQANNHAARSADSLHRPVAGAGAGGHLQTNYNNNNNSPNQPEAASLINNNGLDASSQREQQPQVTFECLVGFDKKKDKNLVIKWHHDERVEPIYQWIPELNKRSIAPQYRAYIAPIVGQPGSTLNGNNSSSILPINGQNVSQLIGNPNQIQLLEAGFKLIRPSKELGGKYTCSAISVQNDDSKSKKMIVFTPPRSFRFNASRTDIGALLTSQRDRLIQLTQPATLQSFSPSTAIHSNQLPLAYRMRGFDTSTQLTTISPQMYSTIDYVNVNQQRLRQTPAGWTVTAPPLSAQVSDLNSADMMRLQHQTQQMSSPQSRQPRLQQKQTGIKLVCDIDQVFPVPEVSIYRIAKLDGSHPNKLAKLDTRIERDISSGLFHIQVTSILDDADLEAKYGLDEPLYFECLIALTNLELSRYADNKRSIIYSTSALGDNLKFDRVESSAAIGVRARFFGPTFALVHVIFVTTFREYLLNHHN